MRNHLTKVAAEDIRNPIQHARTELAEVIAVMEGVYDDILETPGERKKSIRKHLARALADLNAAEGNVDLVVREQHSDAESNVPVARPAH